MEGEKDASPTEIWRREDKYIEGEPEKLSR